MGKIHMIITEDVLTAYNDYLHTRGMSPKTIIAYISNVRVATAIVGTTWTATTDFAPFLEGTPANTRRSRQTSLNRFFKWLRMTDQEHLPLLSTDGADGADADGAATNQSLSVDPSAMLSAVVAAITTTALPTDVRAIFLLIAVCGLRTGEVLALDIHHVTDQATVLLVSGRPYPLDHVPQTQAALAAWLHERPAADTPAVFVTRQHGRRTQVSLRPWWAQVVGADGPTLSQVQQARANTIKQEHPDIAGALLGYANAPSYTAAALRAALK